MTIRYSEKGTDVTGPVTVDVFDKAIRHTVACEGASGSITITVVPVGMTAAQAIENDTIDLTAPLPLYIEGTIESIILTKSGGGTFSYSVTGE